MVFINKLLWRPKPMNPIDVDVSNSSFKCFETRNVSFSVI